MLEVHIKTILTTVIPSVLKIYFLIVKNHVQRETRTEIHMQIYLLSHGIEIIIC